MEKLTDRHSVRAVMKALRFQTIRLGSRPEAAQMAREMGEQRRGLHDLNEAFLNAQERRIGGTAEIRYHDRRLDKAVMDLAREVVALTRGRRDDPRYLKLFPAAPSSLMQGVTGDRQARFTRSLVSLLQEDADYSELSGHAETIGQHLADLDAAIARREDLYMPEFKAQADLTVALDQACRAYNLSYPRLVLLFPDDNALVESFFAELRGRGPAE